MFWSWAQLPYVQSFSPIYSEGADDSPQVTFPGSSVSWHLAGLSQGEAGLSQWWKIGGPGKDWVWRRKKSRSPPPLLSLRWLLSWFLSPSLLQPPLHPDPPQFLVSIGSSWPLGSRNCLFSHYPSSLRKIKLSAIARRQGYFIVPCETLSLTILHEPVYFPFLLLWTLEVVSVFLVKLWLIRSVYFLFTLEQWKYFQQFRKKNISMDTFTELTQTSSYRGYWHQKNVRFMSLLVEYWRKYRIHFFIEAANLNLLKVKSQVNQGVGNL